MRDNYTDYGVDWGYTTSDGEKLRKHLTKDIPNAEYNNLKQKIQIIQRRLDEIESIINTDDEEEFTQLRNSGQIDKYGDEWSELYDKQREYLDQISNIEAYKTVWK